MALFSSSPVSAYAPVGADAEEPGAPVASLLGEAWWRTCEVEEIRGEGASVRWRLRDTSDHYGLAITTLARDFSAAAMLLSLNIQKTTSPGAAALVRLSVNTGPGEPQAWDLSFDPATGLHQAAGANGRVFGRLTDNLDSWRASIAALVRPEVAAELQACLAPAIGPRPGVYSANARGEIVVRDVRFRRLRIDQFLRLTSDWSAESRAPA